MPLSIPAFVQFQSPMFPLRGLWNRRPEEGDQFVNAEIDWLVSPPGNAVQFSLSGNSPVALSQIVALSVDNGRCGADVDFIFPDSGFVLTVPAHNQGVFPVFTNALMFYASAPGSAAGDVTIVQILNSLPPPIPVAPTEAQNVATVSGISIANGTYGIINPPTSGTLNTLSLNVVNQGAAAGAIQVNLVDGTGKTIWAGFFDLPVAGSQFVNLSGLALRFVSGVRCIVSNSTLTAGEIIANLYYSSP
jgi:hypothetical protein